MLNLAQVKGSTGRAVALALSGADGSTGVDAFTLGASYVTYEGGAGVAADRKVEDLLMQGLPQTANFTLTKGALVNSSTTIIIDDLDNDLLTTTAWTTNPNRPKVVILDGGGTLAEYLAGTTAVEDLLEKEEQLADLIRADAASKGNTVTIVLHSAWGYPDAGWALGGSPVFQALNAAHRSDITPYADVFVDMVTVFSTIEDVQGDGRPDDQSLFETEGNGNHPASRLARGMSDAILLAVRDNALSGLPVTLPDDYRITTDDSANPTSIVVRKGRRSMPFQFIARRAGSDFTDYTPAVDSASRDIHYDGSDTYTDLTENHVSDYVVGNEVPMCDKATVYNIDGANTDLTLSNGEDYNETVQMTTAAGYTLAAKWLIDLIWLLVIDEKNAGTADAREANIAFIGDPRLNLVDTAGDVDTWDDLRGSAFGALQFSVTGGTPTISTTTVGGEDVTQIDLASGDEIATAYSPLLSLGTDHAHVYLAVNMAAAAGGVLRIETADGRYVEAVGGATNIEGGSSIQATADLSPATPRVASGGNSWRQLRLSWRWLGGDFVDPTIAIDGHGSRGVINTGAGALADGRMRIAGPCSIRFVMAAQFEYSATVTDGRGTMAKGVREVFNTRYGTTQAA